ncbi:GNAT family N-acetyltransferase [Nocardiopsis sp. MG754419]|uniref:GNAT family N-acetyltransferase n=1 Tax=Nocardiopsis sp. MG754419 TaxID=2259865 RepID=UPI001BA9318F|nr:GNAT family protein [Nocardiopsis sp. MG754419]MBR8740987.1 GNAT family N-acetyltransferase [Nocardiopsis sp. MG754419]
MLVDHFPPLGVRLTTPRLTLRMPSESDLAGLAEAAVAGVHDPTAMPFLEPWTDQPPRRLASGVIRHNWRTMGAWTPESWLFNAVVEFEGRVVGVQDMRGRDFAVRREVGTGSWLTRSVQGRGIGTEMRAAVLHLAFEGLGALEATTEAFETTAASKGVSERLGYRPDGIGYVQVRGERVREVRYRLGRADWERHRTVPVRIEGLEPALPYFGLGDLPA